MGSKLSRAKLRHIRNDINIVTVIDEVLGLPHQLHEGHCHFRCPLCGKSNSDVNPNTNLARCFSCKKNFNPIDLVMTAQGCSFLEAVDLLRPLT